jgi:RNA polymerase sigma-70 factor, ECF subfamily
VNGRLSAADLRQAADPMIIALACAGDDGAFAEIVRRRHARVRKFMYYLCRQSSLGDDLAQQVFITAWRSLGQLRAAAAFDGWLRRIMVTTWLQEVRRRKLDIAAEVSSDAVHIEGDTSAVRLDLDAALARLSPDARLCIVLAYDQGLTHPQIATLTGMPLGTVKSHLTRGAMQLRTLLDAYSESMKS